MEWLEMLVAYPSDPPPFDLNEVVNQWEDWNASSPSYSAPTYTIGEAEKLSLVATAWEDFCNATQKRIANESEALMKPEWAKLAASSRAALLELQRRGKLSEEVVVGHGNTAA